MSKDGSRDTYFTAEMKHTIVEDFIVGYYNKTIIPDLKRYSVNDLPLVSYFDPNEFQGLADNQMVAWDVFRRDSYTDKPTKYSVNLKDERFMDLDELIDKYSDVIPTPDTEKPAIESRLYSLVLILRKEERVTSDFQLIPYRDAMLDKFGSGLERATKLIEALEKRVKNIENNPFLKTGINK